MNLRQALLDRPVDVERFDFTPGRGCYLREYTIAELDRWSAYAGRSSDFKQAEITSNLQRLKIAWCCLKADAPDAERFFFAGETLSEADFARLLNLPPGLRSRLVAAIDRLSGERRSARNAAPPAPEMDAFAVPDAEAVLTLGTRIVRLPDAFGEGLHCFARGYTGAEYDAWVEASVTGGRYMPDRLAQLEFRHVALLDHAGATLFEDAANPTKKGQALLAKIKPGWLSVVNNVADDLSGWNSGALRDWGLDCPFHGPSSASGASTASTVPPPSSKARSAHTSTPTPPTRS
jgi:hypothetical protein